MSGTASRRPQKRGWAWTDRGGRFSPFKTTVLVLLCVPAVYIATIWATGNAGARPVTEVIHQTGLWAVRLLVLSLLVSPARAILQAQKLLLVRRMIGVAAACFAAAHLTLYADDQNWRLLHVASEIVRRFYLTIGFVALLGLLALAATSTNGWIRRLGRGWKRLHRLAYPIGGLALLHFFLQSKADVSAAVVYAGVFVWLMLWRALPAGADRSLPALLGLAPLACLLTVGIEYLWYRLETHIPPARVVRAELDLSFGPRPAGQVLLLACLVPGALLVRRAQLAWPGLPARLAVSLGAVLGLAVLAYAFSLMLPFVPDDVPAWAELGLALALAALAAGAWWGVERRGGRVTPP